MDKDETQMSDRAREGFLSKEEQLAVILKENPAEDEFHTWIRSIDDILTFEEVWQDDIYNLYPDYTAEDVEKALDTGVITVYSSKPIVNDIFVTPSAMEAAAYSGDQTIYKATLNTKDVSWIDDSQGQLATGNKIEYSRVSAKGLIYS